jgi:DNA-binding NarL/FixJ family response regulator
VTTLTARETKILDLLLEGKKDKEIARELHVTDNTVRSYLRVIEAKLDASCRIVAAVKYDRLRR